MKKDVCEENVKMAEKQVVMTLEGLKKLEDELENLKTVRRAEISEKIKIARGFGDLSENAEYDEAKNEQGKMEHRINEIEETLKNARIIDENTISNEKVQVGSKVKVKNVTLDMVADYKILGEKESDPMNGIISAYSPIGAALIGHSTGESVNVEVPMGIVTYEILEISK